MSARSGVPAGSSAEAEEVGTEAAGVAGGSGIVLVAGVVDQALRLGVTWLLARTLGAEGFGLYALAVTVASVVLALAPLGLGSGVLLFLPRHRASGDTARLKGTVLSAVGIATAVGGAATALLVAGALLIPHDPQVGRAIALAAPAVAAGTPAVVLVAVLRAVHDARSQALGFQLGLPLALALGSGVALLGGTGVNGVLVAFACSYGVSLLLLARSVMGHLGGLLRDRSVRPVYEVPALLAFSIPQSITDILFRLALWLDILMLGWLAGMEDVGLYRVAAQVALVGQLWVMAANAMFYPVVAELVAKRELVRLDRLLKVLTRWLVVLTAPLYVGILLLSDLLLGVFGAEFTAGRLPLLVLLAGQGVYLACAVAVPLIPMAGRSRLEMLNGVVAVAVNLGLNLWLIPLHGAVGAAMASAVSIATWSGLRLVESWWLLGCFPFTRRTGLLLALAVAVGLGGAFGTAELAAGWRVALAVLAAGGLGLVGLTLVRGPEDQAVVRRVRERLAAITGRGAAGR